eukprot:9787319-Lingulodinium_polyedra.AAC.1
MEGSTVRDLLQWSQQIGRTLDAGEIRELEVLMEAAQEQLWNQANRLVQEAGHMPVMVSYSSDETRVKVAQAFDFKLPGKHGRKGRRTGKAGVPVLVQH